MISSAAQRKLAKTWIEKILQGDIRTVARACSMIENGDPLSEDLLASIHRFSGKAIVVGITGPPGAGKSSLLSCLIEEALSRQYQVGVIAVDPSSPVSGGALLADRLRMGSLKDDQVYIRSLATRGSLGGLAFAAFGILHVLEAMGKEIIFVETVGAGQNEIAVTQLAATTLYVTVPNLGDEIQALKAGILELADIFIVNKSDLGNSEITASHLRSTLTLKEPFDAPPSLAGEAALGFGGSFKAKSQNRWSAPILTASAARRSGIAQIFSSILSHHKFLESSGEMVERKRKQLCAELFFILEKNLSAELNSLLKGKLLETLLSKKLSPYALAREILSKKRRK